VEKLVESAKEVLRELVREVSDTNELKLVDQRGSPLGRNRHCAAVRRRIDEGKPGAWIVGRKYLLSVEALREELDHLGRRGAAERSSPQGSRSSPREARERLEEKLRLLRGTEP
jgi:hypothetical protein